MEAHELPEVANTSLNSENISYLSASAHYEPSGDSCFPDEEDTRSELRFDAVLETEEEQIKRKEIEAALSDPNTTLECWQKLAISHYGLVNDDLRRKVWPLLLSVDPDPSEKAPLLAELTEHSEYKQVILDVNRSLKRFPPGIPRKQRLALQDQLTVLILCVIMKYPHLKYYQGYHDVAITFLLVVGEAVSFRIMERLSTDHLRECMEPTMEKTAFRLNYIYPLLQREDKELYTVMDSAMIGTMFALPWYLTWFGHSLNQYRDVVRLYDFFLATPPLMPLYVTASLVLSRRAEVMDVGADMASLHCLLSQIPDNLDFEAILQRALQLYKKHPPERLERDVRRRVQKEADQLRRNRMRIRGWKGYIPYWLLLHYKNKYGLAIATVTIIFGLYAYLKATETGFSLFRLGYWNT